MAKLYFKGEIENITERQLEFITNVILEQGFENSTVRFEHVGKVGDNFAANLKRITIEGHHGQLNMIAKIAPQPKASRNPMNVDVAFRNEHIMYTEVLPKLTQLQEEAGIPKEEQLRYAKCYGSLSEIPNEVILLEDLDIFDFKILDRYSPLSNECVKSIFKNFALLHSLSFVLKEKELETFNYIKSRLCDMWILNGEVEYFDTYRHFHEEDTMILLEKEEHVNFVRHKIANSGARYRQLVEADVDNKYSVILQGDSWTNNVMFKFHNEILTESVMIDYQMSKGGSPALDILFMMFLCTDYVTRKQHFNEWIDYYFTELQKCLSKFNLSANLLYPRNILYADFKRYIPSLFGYTMVLSSFLLRKSDDCSNLVEALNSESLTATVRKLSILKQSEDSKTRYIKRITELIDTITELNLL